MRGTQFARLTAFVAVAENRSFTRAASHLGIRVPALSYAVRLLEEQFGVRLLNRTTRSVALTDAGERLFNHLAPVLEDVDKALDVVSEFRDKPAGTLRLTVHPVAGVTVIAPMLARFSAAYPEISLDVSVELEHKDIVGGRFDAGVHPTEAIAQDMVALPVRGPFRFSPVASPGYLGKKTTPETPDALREHNCIKCYLNSADRGCPWKFRKADRVFSVDVKGSLMVNDLTLALRAVLDGAGIAQLPEAWIAPLIAKGMLVRILGDWSPSWMEFSLFYSSRRHLPAKLRALVGFLGKESKDVRRVDAIGSVRWSNVIAGRSVGRKQNRLDEGGAAPEQSFMPT